MTDIAPTLVSQDNTLTVGPQPLTWPPANKKTVALTLDKDLGPVMTAMVARLKTDTDSAKTRRLKLEVEAAKQVNARLVELIPAFTVLRLELHAALDVRATATGDAARNTADSHYRSKALELLQAHRRIVGLVGVSDDDADPLQLATAITPGIGQHSKTETARLSAAIKAIDDQVGTTWKRVVNPATKASLEQQLLDSQAADRKRWTGVQKSIDKLVKAQQDYGRLAVKHRKLSEKAAEKADYVAGVEQRHWKSAQEATTGQKIRNTWGLVEARIDSARRDAQKAAEIASKADPDLVLLRALADVRKALPKDHSQKATMQRLETAVNAAVHQKKYDAMRSTFGTKFESLRKVGDRTELKLNFELGAALEAVGIARLRATAVHGQTFALERLANGKYKAQRGHSLGVKVGVKTGFNADVNTGTAKANAYLGHSWDQARTYDSLEELVTSETESMLNMGLPGKDHKDSTKVLKAREKLLREAKAQRVSLERDLVLIGAVDPKKQILDDPELSGSTMVRKQIRTLTGQVDASVRFQLGKTVTDGGKPGGGFGAGAGGGLTVSRRVEQEFKRFSFLDDVLTEPALQRLHMMGNPQHIQFGDTSGIEAVNSMDALKRDYARLAESTEPKAEVDKQLIRQERTAIWGQLQQLEAEYDLYVAAHNLAKDGDNKLQKKQSTELRNKLAERRGVAKVGDAAEYLRSISVQYAALEQLYTASFDAAGDSQNPTVPGRTSTPDAERERQRAIETNQRNTRLKAFRSNLAQPRLTLTDKESKAVFGDEAATEKTIVKTTTASLDVGASLTLARKKGKGSQKGIGPSAKLAASLTMESATKPNSVEATKTFSVTVTGDMSVFAPGLFGSDTSQDSSDAKDKRTALYNATSNLLSPKAMSGFGLPVSDDASPDMVEAWTQLLRKRRLVPGDNQTMRFDFVVVHGRIWLKTASAVEAKSDKLGVGGSVPIGATGVNLAIQLSRERNRRRILHQYRAAKTLSGVTDVLRSTGKGPAWIRFKKESGLITRLTKQLATDDGAGVATGGGDLAKILADIKSGAFDPAQKKAALLHAKGKSKKTVGLANDVVAWTLDLKGGEKTEQKAADRFIDTYLVNRSKLAEGDDKAAKAVESAMEKLIVAKEAKETRTADDGFAKAVHFSDAEIRLQVARDLIDRKRRLVTELGDNATVEISMADLRKLALKRYKRNYKHTHGDSNATDAQLAQLGESNAKELRLLKQVLALEHVQKSVEDLTAFNSEADRRKALGLLGSSLDDLLTKDAKMKVYMGELMDGRLEINPEDGKLRVVVVIKKGRAPVTSTEVIRRNLKRTEAALHFDSVDDANSTSSIMDVTVTKDQTTGRMNLTHRLDAYPKVESTHSAEVEWNGKMYDKQAERSYHKELGKRKGAVLFAETTGFVYRSKPRRTRNGKGIGQLIQQVMDQEAEEKKRLRTQQARRTSLQH